MQGEISNDKVIYSVTKNKLGTHQAVVECRLTIPDGGAKKLLEQTQQAYIISSEVLEGELNYSGSVVLSAIYLNDAGEINSATSSFAFSSSFLDASLNPSDKAQILPRIIDVSVESINDNEIRVIVTIESDIYVIKNEEVNVFSDEHNSLKVLSSMTEISSLFGQKSASVQSTYDFAVKGKIQKVILATSNVVIKDSEAGTNYFVVSGEGEASFLIAEENGEQVEIKNITMPFDFKEEVEAEGIDKDSLLEVFALIRQDQITTSLSQNDNESKLTINFPLDINASIYKVKQVPTIQDVYSLTNHTLITLQSYSQTRPCFKTWFEDKIDGTTSIPESELRIDKVLAVKNNGIKQTTSYLDDGELYINGVASVNIIFFNDENSSINSLDIDIPFETSKKLDSSFADCLIDTSVMLTDEDVSVKKGREVYVEGKLKVFIQICCRNHNAIISNVEIGEEYPEKESAIEIYFATEGQSLWEVAKELHEDVELLLSQNPEIPELMVGNERIVVYHQREINFA